MALVQIANSLAFPEPEWHTMKKLLKIPRMLRAVYYFESAWSATSKHDYLRALRQLDLIEKIAPKFPYVMLFKSLIRVLLPSALLACGAQDKDDVFSTYKTRELVFKVYDGEPSYDPDDPNLRLNHRLLPNELEFARAQEVQEVSLHSVILMPSAFDDALLTLEFRRSDLDEAFVQGLFFQKDPEIVNVHPFAQRGIEAILTDERLILSIHPGVTLHLRNDMENAPNYETFSNPEVVAKVTHSTGEIFISLDPILTRFRLRDIYVKGGASMDFEAPGVVIEEKSERHKVIWLSPEALKMPELYPPRVVEGP